MYTLISCICFSHRQIKLGCFLLMYFWTKPKQIGLPICLTLSTFYVLAIEPRSQSVLSDCESSGLKWHWYYQCCNTWLASFCQLIRSLLFRYRASYWRNWSTNLVDLCIHYRFIRLNNVCCQHVKINCTFGKLNTGRLSRDLNIVLNFLKTHFITERYSTMIRSTVLRILRLYQEDESYCQGCERDHQVRDRDV